MERSASIGVSSAEYWSIEYLVQSIGVLQSIGVHSSEVPSIRVPSIEAPSIEVPSIGVPSIGVSSIRVPLSERLTLHEQDVK